MSLDNDQYAHHMRVKRAARRGYLLWEAMFTAPPCFRWIYVLLAGDAKPEDVRDAYTAILEPFPESGTVQYIRVAPEACEHMLGCAALAKAGDWQTWVKDSPVFAVEMEDGTLVDPAEWKRKRAQDGVA